MRGKQLPIITKEELAQAVAGCELDPVAARSGKDNLFKEQYYDRVFPNTDAEYYLPRYWLMKEVTKGARGAPQRGYTKWLVLNFVWNHIGSSLRSVHAKRRFVEFCHKQYPRLVTPLSLAVNAVYVQALGYYRANRGTGESEMDISLFFRSKLGRNREFAAFWKRLPRARKQKLNGYLARVGSVLDEDR
jgi:hypothetical protein